MSKCQINKYRPGGRCGGDTVEKHANPEFNSSLASMMQRREAQDSLWQTPVQTPVQSQQKTVVIAQKSKRTPKEDLSETIALLLEGDY